MARKNQVDYPDICGSRRVGMWNHTGPSSYVAVSNAVPATGGDIITQSELTAQGGSKAADTLTAPMCSDNGQYEVAIIPINGNNPQSQGVVPSTSFTLRWIVSATGAEVAPCTNLSSRTINLVAVGR